MTKQEKLMEVIKERVCSKCGYPTELGLGSLQSKIVNGKLVHIKCPVKRVVTKEEIREGMAMKKIRRKIIMLWKSMFLRNKSWESNESCG